jgi:hypothetical protein
MDIFNLLKQLFTASEKQEQPVAPIEITTDKGSKRHSPYKSGRPFRFDPQSGQGSTPPDKPGAYTIRDANKQRYYHGETSNLAQRVKDHTLSGKVQDGYTVDYKVADGRSTSGSRRKVETKKINTHNPPGNQRKGGGGRKAGK